MRTPIFFRDMKCGIGLVLSLAVAWSVPSITHADHVTWTNCGSSSDIGKVMSVSFSPDPPEKGKNLLVVVNTSLDEAIQSGSLVVSITYHLAYFIPVPVISQTFPLCSDLTGLHCPLNGPHEVVKFNRAIPSFAPDGKYTGEVVATGEVAGNKKQIVCLNLAFNLS